MSEPTRIPDARPASGKRALLAQLLQKKLAEPRRQPASFAQERLWFLHQLAPQSPMYNIPAALCLRGALDVAALEQTLTEIVRRHEALRTTFAVAAGQPLQVITPPRPVPLPVTDLCHLPEGRRQAEARRRANAEAQCPFDLEQGPLLRTSLLRLGEQEHILLLTLHHSVADGWSLGVLVRELGALYPACRAGRPSPLPPPPLQYPDYAVWQRQWLQGAVLQEQLAYWRARLRGLAVLELPTDRPRPASLSFRGAAQSFDLPSELLAALQALCRREKATLFMTLLAAFQALLGRHAGQDDVSVGTPVANRNRAELEGLIGFFVNTLVLRADLSGNPSFRALLARVREAALGAYAHQDLPFERLVADLQPQRDPSRNPLFQVMFALQNAPLTRLQLPGLTVSRLDTEEASSTFDLSVSLRETGEALAGWCEYSTDLFDEATIRRLLGHYRRLLEAIVANPDRRLGELPLLTEAERHQILADWSSAPAGSPPARCLHRLFEEQAERAPDAVAVVSEREQLTYRELNRRANRLAHFLRRAGVGAEVPVAVCLERSAELVVALLAVLKAGGAYVPLDPAYPRERLALLLHDARAPLLLAQQELLPGLPPFRGTSACLDTDGERIAAESPADPIAAVDADNLAYVLFTSGSTGKPKGVAVSHGAAAGHFVTVQSALALGPDDRVLQFASPAFDVSLEEIFPTLLTGATLVLPGPDLWAPADFLHQAARLGLSVVNLPTAYWREVVEHLHEPAAGLALRRQGWPGHLRLVVVGGEAVPAEAVRLWQRVGLPAVRLVNGYGPTEATVTATLYEVPPQEGDVAESRVPIGRPLPNRSVYVLDRDGQPVPIGVPGELYLGGAGLARGYLHAAALTAERFVPDPFSQEAGARLYRTGDRARWLPDGNLEFLGRLDAQVKVRGFRVEPAEVEAALTEHPLIRQAHVVAREDPHGNKRLVAYLICREHDRPELSAKELREHLQERVPDYMLPAAFVFLQALPTSPNGKVDARALPAPDWAGGERNGAYVAPRTPREQRLAEIWAAVLGSERVGIHDNFFELGGDSILSIQVISRARQAGLHLTPRQMFQHQTVAELAAAAGTASTAAVAAPERETGTIPLTPIQRWFVEQDSPDLHHYNQAVIFQVRPEVSPDLLARALQELLGRHDALRLRFVRQGATWEQRVAPGDERVPFTRVDLSPLPAGERASALEAAAAELQAGLSLSDGPLTRAAFFDLGAREPGRFLWVIHHLAVDGVSWRILLEDLQTAYRQLSQGEAVLLPPGTSSFAQWARRLVEHAEGPQLQQELPYWLAEERRSVPSLPIDFGGRANTVASAQALAASLTEAETRRLLKEVPAAHRVQINDVLLTALAQVLADWTGQRRVLLDLEGHGREAIFADLDLSRTVGWFTSVFPVLLDLGAKEAAGEELRAVKEQLRQVPHHGLGYGVLRYLSRDATGLRLQAMPPAEVCFNYLGQFDPVLAEGSLFSPAREPAGPTESPRRKLSYMLEINAWVAGGRLCANWTYSEAAYRRATVERLANGFCDALRSVLGLSRSPRVYTPSDFPEANLSQKELDRLLAAMRQPRGSTP
jgi:amino acid adenylation domain-containing protein/non-ribosomal peptide synthase protein (TIGR01720 family)